jgi:hypothetical protein
MVYYCLDPVGAWSKRVGLLAKKDVPGKGFKNALWRDYFPGSPGDGGLNPADQGNNFWGRGI